MYVAALTTAVLVYLAVNIAFLRSGLASIYHPFTIYSLVHGVIFVVRPVIAYLGDYRYIYTQFRFMPDVEVKTTVIAAATLGFVAFYLACTRVGNVPMIFKSDMARAVERGKLQNLLPLVWLICAPVGIYSLATNIGVAATDTNTMVTTANGVRINTDRVGYLSEAMLILVSLSAMTAWYYRFKWYSFLPLVAFILFKASTGGRGAFVVAVVMTAFLYFYDRRKLLPDVKWMVVGALGMVFFTMIGEDRGYRLREALGYTNLGEMRPTGSSGDRFLEGMDFANMEFFEYLVSVVPGKSGTYDYFLSNLQLLTEPIPRVLWPGKPAGPPIQLINFFDYGTPYGFTMSLPGVGWYELGWLGVIIWCALWGGLTGWLYKWFVTGSHSALRLTAYLIFLATLVIAYRDGGFITILRSSIFYMFPLIVLWGLRQFYGLPRLIAIQQRLFSQFIMETRRTKAEAAREDTASPAE